MKNGKMKRVGIALLSIAVATPIGLAVPANSAPADIKVGVITSTSGPLKSYGDAYVDGLEWGLNYFTKGTMKVNGAKIVVTKKDDAYSFISGHSSMVATTAAGMWLMSRNGTSKEKLLCTGAATLALGTACLRVAGGKHFTTDVVAGLLIGAGVAYVNHLVHR